jgi:hypothetical protein
MLAAERDTRGLRRVFVAYDDLMRDWRVVARRIEERIGVPFPRNTAAASVEVDRFLKSSLRHYRATPNELCASADVEPHVKTLHRLLVSACEDAEIDVSEFDALAAELAKVDALVGPLLADYRGRVQRIARELDVLERARTESAAEVESLQQELAAERAQRREAEATLLTKYEAVVTELEQASIRESNLEAEQARLSLELDAKKRDVEDLLRRIAEAEAAKQEVLADLEQTRELRRLDEGRLAEERQLNASLIDQLSARDANLEARKSDLDSAVTKLAEAESQLESANRRVADHLNEIDELAQELSLAQSTSRELEQRSAAQLEESAALIRTVLESQQSTADESEKVRRLKQLHDAILSQPKWWSMLPRSHRMRLQLARLRRLNVFDGDSYLLKNPDVAAAGLDPVHHFVHHGIDEKRPL